MCHARWYWVAVPVAAIAVALLFFSGGKPNVARQKAEQALAQSCSEADAALVKRMEDVQAVFARGRKGAEAFADDALSWAGKFAILKDVTGIGEGDAHAKYLTEAFDRHVFAGDDLESALEEAVKGYLSDLDSIENQMLLRLRVDIADSELGRSGKLSALGSDEAFKAEYRRLAADVIPALHIDGGTEVFRQAAGFGAIDLATPVVLRVVELVAAELGVETAFLSVGAASGLVTLGVGLIVGYVADQVIAWLLKQAGYDPAAEIACKVRDSLSRVESPLIDGTPDKPGLRRELQRLRDMRVKTQNAAIHNLLKGGAK